MNGALSLREGPTIDALRNLDIYGNVMLLGDVPYSQYNITAEAPFTIEGLTRIGATADGQIVRLINSTDHTMTIKHTGIGNTPQKISNPSNQDLVLVGKYASVTLQYNKGLSRWTVFGYALKNKSNKYYVVGPKTPAAEISTNTWSDVPNMSITLRPENSIVFITYSLYGDGKIDNFSRRPDGHFRLVKNNTVVDNTLLMTGLLNNSALYRVTLPMFPLEVTPGVEITLKVQWSQQNTGSGTIHNNPYYDLHGRYITIID